MADRSVTVRLRANIDSYRQGMRQAGQATTDFGRQISGHGTATREQMERVGRGALIMSGAMVAGFGLSAKAAINWESAWAGVVKTVDGTESELADLEAGLRRMATELPATHTEIAAVAQAAGQLGIATPAVEGFTRTMIDLGEATNMTADQAAVSMARLANIMQTSQTDFDRMGSTVVDLGNNMATTESEIVEFATRLAAAGQIAGLSEADVLAFAAAMTSVGVGAEAGGTALSKVFMSIRDSVLDGGDNLETFARVAEMSVEDFSNAFREDAAGAINEFIMGLGRMNDAGESTTGVFQELALTDQRLMRALLSVAGAGDVLTNALEIGTRAWDENIALTNEAEKRYETTAAQLSMFRNQVTDLAIDVGAKLLPALTGLTGVAGDVMAGFSDMPDVLQNVGIGLGGVTTAGLGVIGVVGLMAPKIQAAKVALMAMGAAGQFMARAMGPAALILGGITTAVSVGAYLWGQYAKEQEAAEERARTLLTAFLELGGAVEDVNSALLEQDSFSTEIIATMNELGVSIDDVRKITETGTDAFDRTAGLMHQLQNDTDGFVESLSEAGPEARQFAQALVEGYESGRLTLRGVLDLINAVDDAADSFDDAASAAEEMTRAKLETALASEELTAAEADELRQRLDAASTVEEVLGVYDDLIAKLGGVARGEGAVGTAASGAVPDIEDFNERVDETATAAERAELAIKNYTNAIKASMDPLFGAIDALDRHTDAQNAVTAAEWAYIEASGAYDAAVREHGSSSAEAREAALNLAAAEQDVVDANSKVVRSAMDVDMALNEMRILMDEGALSTNEAKHRLDEWVAQGWITEQQARDMAAEFDNLATKVDEIPENKTIRITANLDQANASLDAINARIAGTGRSFGSLMNQDFPTESRVPSSARALGGPVMAGQAYAVNEYTPRTEYMVPAADGQILTHQQAMEALSGLSGGSSGPNLTLKVDGRSFGPGEVDALADVISRKLGWGLGMSGRA